MMTVNIAEEEEEEESHRCGSRYNDRASVEDAVSSMAACQPTGDCKHKRGYSCCCVINRSP